jgi:HAE1 family hydrophobic/amphiphilic exporter-1
MFSKFFIERPIFANVIAIVTMLLGAVALIQLPIAQYPEIAPPTVLVSTVYPGANAKVIAETVGAPIEQEVNGVENMLYMSSTSANDGSYSLTVTFEVGTDLDIGTVLVQNRVNVASSSLPEDVRRQGVTVKKQSPNILLVVAIESPDGRYDDLFLSNFAALNVKDEIARVKGVGDVIVYGAEEYSMRVWLDPRKLKARGLTTQDVLRSIQEQNVQVAAGQLGQQPAPADQSFQYTINTLGRLSDVEQFENIIIKTAREEAGQIIRVRDIARVELGGKSYDRYAEKNGKPCAIVAVYLLPGANALATAEAIKAVMEDVSAAFPPGVAWSIPYDTTRFVEAAIEQVYHTLGEAAILVLVVILLFLQDWRALLVPATTVPVTILSAFFAMAALGFSINLLTLFGIVLCIGIVVDDAIIIVEGAAHNMDHGMTPKEATIQAMKELFGPIIGITLVLIAVFLPSAFLPGITGQLYRQFALVIASAAVISAINAATLKPAQTALWMRPSSGRKNAFFRVFNRGYEAFERFFTGIVRIMVRFSIPMMAVFLGLIVFTVWSYSRIPTGFLPTEDQGYAIIAVKLPDAASQTRTHEVTDKMSDIIRDTPGVSDWVTFGGLSILDEGANLPNTATTFVTYKDWSERGKEISQESILAHLRREFGAIQEAFILPLIPPAIQGLGQAGGFQLMVRDRADVGLSQLEQVTFEMIAAGMAQSALTGLGTTFSASTPQLFADVDRTQAKTLDMDLSDVFGTLQTFLGAAYVNDFNKFGRVYQVRVQADAPFRLSVADIKNLEVRNRSGGMVPLGALVDIEETLGPAIVTRYNLYPASSIFGEAAPGFSSGQALDLMEQIAANTLPPGMDIAWTGASFQERKVGSEAYLIFALAVTLVFLVLAGQYESWIAPAAVILVVPLALLGVVAALAVRGFDNNVYTQIGVVLLIGLASKNAILIVEVARELRLVQRMPIRDAALEAARRRLRPIIMTSFAFILGVVPLLVASGAGAASQQAVGTAVFGGMLASTFLAVLFVPVFFVVLQRLSERFSPLPRLEPEPAAQSGE